jgi:hypothetical protein
MPALHGTGDSVKITLPPAATVWMAFALYSAAMSVTSP